jgi:hypothetical protein
VKKFELSIIDITNDREPFLEISPYGVVLPQFSLLKLTSARAVSIWLDYLLKMPHLRDLSCDLKGGKSQKSHSSFALQRFASLTAQNTLDRLSVHNPKQGSDIAPLFKALNSCTSLRFLSLNNCNLDTSSMPMLNSLIIYNEKIEVLDLSHNRLSGFNAFFKNLNRNWLSKLSQLILKDNLVSYQDLKDFCDIFERESRPFDRLLFVLRFLNL